MMRLPIRIIFILLLIPSVCFGDFKVNGISAPGKANGISNPGKVNAVSAPAGGTDYTSGAVAAYLMNSNNTNETDRSGNGETLVQTGGTNPTSSTVPSGFFGTSRIFSSGNGYLVVSNGVDITGDDMTGMLWVYVTADTTAHIMSKYATTGDNRVFYIRFASSTNHIEVNVSGDGINFTKATSTTALSLNTWYHVAFTVDSINDQLKLYINGGTPEDTQSHTAGLYNASSADFVIGADSEIGTECGAYVDEVLIDDRVFSQSEIEEAMTNGIDGSNGAND